MHASIATPVSTIAYSFLTCLLFIIYNDEKRKCIYSSSFFPYQIEVVWPWDTSMLWRTSYQNKQQFVSRCNRLEDEANGGTINALSSSLAGYLIYIVCYFWTLILLLVQEH